MPTKNVSSDPCEVIAEWEEREGRDRMGRDGTGGSMTEGQREKSFMYTAAFIFQPRARKKVSLISVFDFTTLECVKKKTKRYVEQQMTEEGQ